MARDAQPGGRRRGLGLASLTHAAEIASDGVDVAHTRVFPSCPSIIAQVHNSKDGHRLGQLSGRH